MNFLDFAIVTCTLFVKFGLCQRKLIWCTVSTSEVKKCEALVAYISRDSGVTSYRNYYELSCVQHIGSEECMKDIGDGKADFIMLDPLQIFEAGHFHSLIPISKEVYEGGLDYFYTVAVIKRDSYLSQAGTLHALRNTKACFPSVSLLGGWIVPVSKLIEFKIMDVVDCNNHIKSASTFFNASCAVTVLEDKYNPLGDNDQVLCQLCGSVAPGEYCTPLDRYAGYQGAFQCLQEVGDIAFLKHSTVPQVLKLNINDTFISSDYLLLCLDGSTAPISEYLTCNWGKVPSNALMVSAAKTPQERSDIQKFLKFLVKRYGEAPLSETEFYMFDSTKYGHGSDLLISDDAKYLIDLSTGEQGFKSYLKEAFSYIDMVRSCPVEKVTLCVSSLPEHDKCRRMKIALQARQLKPPLYCLRKETNFECMQAVKEHNADISVFEAGDIYTAGLKYELIPFMAELYNLDTTHYYVVAVSKEDDPDTDILYLRGRTTCHPGIMHGGGWVVPLAYLINNEYIRAYGRDSIKAASRYFAKSCAPGLLDYRYSSMDAGCSDPQSSMNLCHLCIGSGSDFCAREHSEPYYGYTGALHCLVEGGGQVAFLKHTTVQENTDGKKKAWWIRNQLTIDYQLVCRDGTRAKVVHYENCNLGKVRSNAVMTRGGYDRNQTQIDAYVNLLLYAQQFFGRDSDDEWIFKMFHTEEPYADLIFQDATQQLVPLPLEEQHYQPYLGQEFLNMRYTVDCDAGCATIWLSFSALCLVLAVVHL